MNHEFWNEIGNLYFMCGAYEPAIHAYLRSIKLENTFGRSYSNLALAYVQTGKYSEAIKLYLRSIELLSDKKEKAVTWNRLGILYRQIKEYEDALEAYQRADLIMPQEDAEKISEARVESNLPLTVSMPEIDLNSILAKGNFARTQTKSDLTADINAEFEMAESHPYAPTFEEMAASPEFETYFQPEDAIFIPPANTHNEWKSINFVEEVAPVEAVNTLQEALALKLKNVNMNMIFPAELENELNIDPVIEDQLEWDSSLEVKSAENIEPLESTDFFENSSHTESAETIINEAGVEEAVFYSQINYQLTELSEKEQQSLDLEIIKYQQATSKNPRSYIQWEGLGEAYKSAGQYKNAIQAFQKAINANPSNAKSHYRLGLVYAAEQREQEAIRSFKKVLELDPNSAQAHASLASQYRKMGLEQQAREHIEKARAMHLEEESDYNRACLEAICGNNERALDLLEVALQSKQTYITWAQNDPDFSALRNDHRFQILLSTHASMA